MKYIHTPQKSAGGRFLARQLRIRRLRGEIPAYPRRATVVLNWGSGTDRLNHDRLRVINDPWHQQAAANKTKCFRILQQAGIAAVPFTANREQAAAWLAEGNTVVSRGTVTGSGGRGIGIVIPGQELPFAPLYTKFMPSVREYRVHVVRDAVLPARKVKRNNAPEQAFPIRNLGDTWAFQYTIPEGTPVPELVLTLAKQAVAAAKLDFGAVDILYHGKGRASVLEINTAPGIEHSVASSFYVRELQRLVNEQA